MKWLAKGENGFMLVRLKENRFVLLVPIVLLSVLTFFMYPRSLERATGIYGFSASDISSISITMDTYYQSDASLPMQRESLTIHDVTDEAFIGKVTGALSNHHMRRRINAGGMYYFRAELEKPDRLELSFDFAAPDKEDTFLVIFADAKTIQLNGGNYVIYGTGIDTVALMNAVERLRDE